MIECVVGLEGDIDVQTRSAWSAVNVVINTILSDCNVPYIVNKTDCHVLNVANDEFKKLNVRYGGIPLSKWALRRWNYIVIDILQCR